MLGKARGWLLLGGVFLASFSSAVAARLAAETLSPLRLAILAGAGAAMLGLAYVRLRGRRAAGADSPTGFGIALLQKSLPKDDAERVAGLAAETRLIALNAALEAARAGAPGFGLAAAARGVGNLSRRAGIAADRGRLPEDAGVHGLVREMDEAARGAADR